MSWAPCTAHNNEHVTLGRPACGCGEDGEAPTSDHGQRPGGACIAPTHSSIAHSGLPAFVEERHWNVDATLPHIPSNADGKASLVFACTWRGAPRSGSCIFGTSGKASWKLSTATADKPSTATAAKPGTATAAKPGTAMAAMIWKRQVPNYLEKWDPAPTAKNAAWANKRTTFIR